MKPSHASLFDRRAAEKVASRSEEERALAAGEQSREQLRQENGCFGSLVEAPIVWSEMKHPR